MGTVLRHLGVDEDSSLGIRLKGTIGGGFLHLVMLWIRLCPPKKKMVKS